VVTYLLPDDVTGWKGTDDHRDLIPYNITATYTDAASAD